MIRANAESYLQYRQALNDHCLFEQTHEEYLFLVVFQEQLDINLHLALEGILVPNYERGEKNYLIMNWNSLFMAHYTSTTWKLVGFSPLPLRKNRQSPTSFVVISRSATSGCV